MSAAGRQWDSTRDVVKKWLAFQLPAAEHLEVSPLEVFSIGRSGNLFAFDAKWSEAGAARAQGMVVRVEPANANQLFLDPNFEAQIRVMAALCEHSVRVPQVMWFEQDASVLGGRFFVMARVSGRPAQIGMGEDWVSRMGDSDRARIWWNGLEAMSQAHRVDVEDGGLSFLDQRQRGATGLDQQLAYYDEYYEWIIGTTDQPRVPVLEDVASWLREHKPPAGPPCLTWGDARIGNILYDDELNVTAMVDWEQCALGTAEIDLAWWYFVEQMMRDITMSFPSRMATLDRYSELIGRPIRHFDYYLVFAAYRIGVLMLKLEILMGVGDRSATTPNVGLRALFALVPEIARGPLSRPTVH
jgi:aminoglycoside phosphotransferase (APT) family kinase protein